MNPATPTTPGACANPVARATAINSTCGIPGAIRRVPMNQATPDQASHPMMLKMGVSTNPNTNAVPSNESWMACAALSSRPSHSGSGGLPWYPMNVAKADARAAITTTWSAGWVAVISPATSA